MGEASSSGSSPPGGLGSVDPGGRLVYVVSQDAVAPRADDEQIDIFRLWSILWRSRWLIVAVTAAFAVSSAVYTRFLPRLYTASVVLVPVGQQQALSAFATQLGGLANLAGISSLGRDTREAVAVLRSRDFARAFIEEEGLLPLLFPDLWDAEAGAWTVEEPPSLPDAAGFFVGQVRQVEEDSAGLLVTLSIEWLDPELAAAWANLLAVRLNDHMRERALSVAEANVKYLRHEFENTSVVALQASISGLLENEMQKVMVARGNSEFAFRIIDRAEVPTGPSKPRTTLIVALATFFGAMLSIFLVLVWDMIWRRHHSARSPAEARADRAP